MTLKKDGITLVDDQGGGGGASVDIVAVGGSPITKGQKVMADSFPVVIASDQSAIPVTGSFSPVGTQDVNLLQVGSAAVTLGIKTAANSIPVVLPSDGTLPLPTGAATEATLATRASQATVASILAQLDVALSTRASQVTAAAILAQLDVALSTRASQATLASVLAQLDVALSTRLAEATFTARINTLGQKASAASTPVVIASDQSAVPISAASLPLPTGASTAALQTQPGVDIGDVTVNNGAGAAAVNIQDGGNSITVDGSVTANAGTNLNTSALNLEATQVAVAASLSVIDDWDESDRAKVNPIVGQAGIQGGAGAVSALTTRVAIATDANAVQGPVAHDAAVAATVPQNISGVAQNMDDTAPPNRVSAEADVVRVATDRDGAIFVRPFGPQIWSYHEDSSSALTDATVHATPGAGLSLYVTDIKVSTGAATAFNVFLEEGASKVLGPYYLEAINGRGFAFTFMTPKKITPDTALTITTSAAIAHSIDITGFVAQG